jgi:DNA-directed RNA polymerase specialized sigma24 family protein
MTIAAVSTAQHFGWTYVGSSMLDFAMPFPIAGWRGAVDTMDATRGAYNLCLRILGSEHEAADATQDAFVNVLRRLPKLEGRELAFGSYLFTSARHACYDLIERRRRAEPTVVGSWGSSSASRRLMRAREIS